MQLLGVGQTYRYRAFYRIGQAKFAKGGSILGSRKFIQLSQLPLKTTLDFKKSKSTQNSHLGLLI